MRGPLHTGHEERVAAGVSFVWQNLPPLLESLDGVPRDVERLHFRRQKKSHRGIAELKVYSGPKSWESMRPALESLMKTILGRLP